MPFRFTGKLTKLTLAIDRPQLTPADEKLLMKRASGTTRRASSDRE